MSRALVKLSHGVPKWNASTQPRLIHSANNQRFFRRVKSHCSPNVISQSNAGNELYRATLRPDCPPPQTISTKTRGGEGCNLVSAGYAAQGGFPSFESCQSSLQSVFGKQVKKLL